MSLSLNSLLKKKEVLNIQVYEKLLTLRNNSVRDINGHQPPPDQFDLHFTGLPDLLVFLKFNFFDKVPLSELPREYTSLGRRQTQSIGTI